MAKPWSVIEHKMLSFGRLRRANLERMKASWPGEDPWEPWDWTNAMAGEGGEACAEMLALMTALMAHIGNASNLSKKMNRIARASDSPHNRPEDRDIQTLVKKLLREVGDVVIYADLIAWKMNASLADVVCDTFNAKSDQIGSTVKLTGPIGFDQGLVRDADIQLVYHDDRCPRCGGTLEFDEVDIGVGTLRGNPGCPDCHWVPVKDVVVEPGK